MPRFGIPALFLGIYLLGGCDTANRPPILPESSGLEAGSIFRDCDECPEMVVIPAGSFEMGSDERPQEGVIHSVSIGKPFAVGIFEVTFDEWDACVRDGGCGEYRPNEEGWGRGRQPVINVSWRQAWSYAWWLREKTGQTYRMLSEAEWEYIARAGTRSRFWWGDDVGSGDANCKECGGSWDGKRAAPVGSFQPNAFGVYDTAGNVWEWVEDCHPFLGRFSQVPGLGYEGAPVDGSAVLTNAACHLRVQRGGSWRDRPWHIRPANRSYAAKGYGNFTIGFRVARDLE